MASAAPAAASNLRLQGLRLCRRYLRVCNTIKDPGWRTNMKRIVRETCEFREAQLKMLEYKTRVIIHELTAAQESSIENGAKEPLREERVEKNLDHQLKDTVSALITEWTSEAESNLAFLETLVYQHPDLLEQVNFAAKNSPIRRHGPKSSGFVTETGERRVGSERILPPTSQFKYLEEMVVELEDDEK